jgi:hypothetical protein
MPSIPIFIKWSDSIEVLVIDVKRFGKGDQLLRTAETSQYGSPRHYLYNTSSTFEPDENGGGLLKVYYERDRNKHLRGSGYRWGESRLWLDPKMTSGKVEWLDAAERGQQAKIHSTTPADRIRWRRLSELQSPFSARKRQLIERAARRQEIFRERLLMIDPECAITGERQTESLEAAHVVSVASGGRDIESNGILLRADLHRLYDAGLFNILSTGRIRLSKELISPYYKRLLAEFPVIRKHTLERIRVHAKRAK